MMSKTGSSNRSVEEDIAILNQLREQIEEAENNGDLDLMTPTFADDIIVMAPDMPQVVGADAATEFMRGFFSMYDAQMRYTSEEIVVSGELAFDRGTVSSILIPKNGGDTITEAGKYLWLYRRTSEGEWKCIRVIWNNSGPTSKDEES